MTYMDRWLIVVLTGMAITGCSPRKEAARNDAPAVEAPQENAAGIYTIMNEALEAGNTNGAIESLRGAFGNQAFESEKPWIFRNMLDLLLTSGRVDEARELMLTALKDQAPYLQNGFGILYRYYVEHGEASDRLEWTGRLVDAGLSGRMKMYAFGWRLVAVYDSEGMTAALAMLPDCISQFPEDEAKMVLGGFLDRVMTQGDYDGVAECLDGLTALTANAPSLRSLADAVKTNLLLARNEWQAADDHLRAVATVLNDDDLARGLQQFAGQADAAGEGGRVEELSEFILTHAQDKPHAREVAASLWMAAARKTGVPGTVLERLEAVADTGLPFEALARIYRSNFYAVLDAKDDQTIARLLAVGDRLMKSVGPLNDDQGIRMLQLDGSFLAEDYDRAIALVEKGIPGRDKAWQDMALNKIKAHKAIKEGRPEEAIERFRVFMEGVKNWENAEQDPATGIKHTREMTLGRNAMRIAELYTSMGKTDEASLAYEEAADYYTRALATFAPDSKEYELIKSEMAELPSGK